MGDVMMSANDETGDMGFYLAGTNDPWNGSYYPSGWSDHNVTVWRNPNELHNWDMQQTRIGYQNYKVGANGKERSHHKVGAYVTEWSVYRIHRPYNMAMAPFTTALDTAYYAFIAICGDGFDGKGQLGLCSVNDCVYNASSNPYYALQQACGEEAPGNLVVHDPWAAFFGRHSYLENMIAYNGMDANDEPADKHYRFSGGFQALMAAKKQYGDDITIMPSVGGWSLSKMFFEMWNDEYRKNFATSAANLLTAWPFFDGIDIDWELSQDSYQYPLLNAMNEALGMGVQPTNGCGLYDCKEKERINVTDNTCREFHDWESLEVYKGSKSENALAERWSGMKVVAYDGGDEVEADHAMPGITFGKTTCK